MNIADLYALFLRYPKIVTDTREDLKNSLFFALKGERFNGNQFAQQAIEKGAAFVVVDEIVEGVSEEKQVIKVDNVLQTLQDLAHYHRLQLGLPILQITGTNGKTTTKELVSKVLAQKYQVLYTQGNLNNHIGVPKTLLRLTKAHNFAVIETGANHPGEIATLTRIVEPNYGLITNVGRAHLEGFGSFEGVIKTKSELYVYLREKPSSDKLIFIDGDNPYLAEVAQGLPAISYGRPGCSHDIEGEIIDVEPYVSFRWRAKGGTWHPVQTQLIGDYNLPNLLAAVSVGKTFDVNEELISAAIAAYRPTNNRSEYIKTPSNELIVDAYNANPTSMAAALDNFSHIHHAHKMLIIGGMKELGAVSQEEHSKIIEKIKSLEVEKVWLVGDEFKDFSSDFKWFPDVHSVMEHLEVEKVHHQLILIKGSNSQKLYVLPEVL